VLPFLMNGLTHNLLPVSVTTADGKPLSGELQFQVNRTKDGYVVLLMNNRGVDKTQNGVARVDRRQVVDVIVRAKQPLRGAKEWTANAELPVRAETEVSVRVHPGDVQVIGLVVK
jgi:hypothetical protein